MAKDALWKQPNFVEGGMKLHGHKSWLHAVGSCGASLCSGVPVMQDFYTYFLSHGRDTKRVQGFGCGQSGFEWMERGMCRNHAPVDADARVSFWLAFGITPDEQTALETHIHGLSLQSNRPGIEVDSFNPHHISYYHL
jgi:hypothetical protein